MNSTHKYPGSDWLKDQGFNMLQVLDTARLPEELIQSLIELGVEVRKRPRLVMLGMGGSDLWNRVKKTSKTVPIRSMMMQYRACANLHSSSGNVQR